MPTVTVYNRKGEKVVMEAVGHGMYERIGTDEFGDGYKTGDVVNLDTALQCGSLFTEEQRQRFLKKKAKRGKKA